MAIERGIVQKLIKEFETRLTVNGVNSGTNDDIDNKINKIISDNTSCINKFKERIECVEVEEKVDRKSEPVVSTNDDLIWSSALSPADVNQEKVNRDDDDKQSCNWWEPSPINFTYDWFGKAFLPNHQDNFLEVYNFRLLEYYQYSAMNFNVLQSLETTKATSTNDSATSSNDNERINLKHKSDKHDSGIVLIENNVNDRDYFQDDENIYDLPEGTEPMYDTLENIEASVDHYKDNSISTPLHTPNMPLRKSNNMSKTERIIKELIDTEKNYINILRSVIVDYMDYFDAIEIPSHLLGRSPYLFGNIRKIYASTSRFYNQLLQSDYDWQIVADIFIRNKSLFELYPIYSKNKPKALAYIQNDFYDLIEKRRAELNQNFGLESNLMVPIQRLPKYILLLKEIRKELCKLGVKSLHELDLAIATVETELSKGNDYIAMEDIHDWPEINKDELGSFVNREMFTIKSPKKFESMVFLFKNMLVFTTIDNNYNFVYKCSVHTKDMSLAIMEHDPVVFHVTEYSHKKRKKKGLTYVIEAKAPHVKELWTNHIYNMLAEQFNTFKKNQIEMYQQEGKRTSIHRI